MYSLANTLASLSSNLSENSNKNCKVQPKRSAQVTHASSVELSSTAAFAGSQRRTKSVCRKINSTKSLATSSDNFLFEEFDLASEPSVEIYSDDKNFEGDDNPMNKRISSQFGDKPREECGVVGIYGDPDASRTAYLALHALQHRGQEGAGIVTSGDGKMKALTGMGLVSEVFEQSKLSKLEGTNAVGHVRYATSGESVLKNVQVWRILFFGVPSILAFVIVLNFSYFFQPFVARYRFGAVAVAHNGNLVNYSELHAMLEEQGSIFNTSSDTEVILHLIAMSKVRPFISRLVNACEQLQGAYSLVFLTEDKLFAVRDPHGFRPLVLGRKENGAVVVASETCALELIDAKYEREVNPGEVLVVDESGISSLCLLPQKQRKACIFEHIYFALPNSVVFGRSVYQASY